ncbi:phage head closure protein [Wukongibacter sp. M2B1]|uniref:phage head closure protein n=1 Tax=Wukongibacter sp. M2B1 TaxID=3088895 RepID=UPI003D7A05CF
MNVRIGELNKKIEIGTTQNVQEDDDGFNVGQFVKDFSPWASVKNMSGTEIFKANADYNKKKVRFLIRYRRDKIVTEDMKVKYKDVLYDIIHVNNYNESNEYLEIITEVVK